MDDKKKVFVIPEAEVIYFANDDVITLSEHATEGFLHDGEQERW